MIGVHNSWSSEEGLGGTLRIILKKNFEEELEHRDRLETCVSVRWQSVDWCCYTGKRLSGSCYVKWSWRQDVLSMGG
jgi:hypothetical protein